MTTKPTKRKAAVPDKAVALRAEAEIAKARKGHVHIYHGGAVCETDKRGQAMPDGRSPLELVLDATEGFIPLWDRDVMLRYRFNEASMLAFLNPAAAKQYIRQLFGEALMLWGLDNIPVRFTEAHDAWDFEIRVSSVPNCDPNGCVLASAFFPDGGQHELRLYPTMFSQVRQEQIETMAHEIGHIFGLRHFFAELHEAAAPSVVFGTHNELSIMNYGAKSQMTDADKADLRALYVAAWSGALTHINGTPIRLVKPFSALRVEPVPALAFAPKVGMPTAAAVGV